MLDTHLRHFLIKNTIRFEMFFVLGKFSQEAQLSQKHNFLKENNILRIPTKYATNVQKSRVKCVLLFLQESIFVL